jgi:Tfp pilus assembly protein PilX
MKCHHNNKGTVLLYIIATMTILTALGTSVFYMTTTSSFSGLGVSAQNKAISLAEAGIRYALANLRTLQNTTSPLPEYKLNNAAADKFILEVSNLRSGVNANIKSSGIVNPGTPFQASHKISLDISPAQYQPLTSAPFSFAGAGSGGITSLTTFTGTSGVGKSGATGVSVDTANLQLKLGLGQTSTYGCVWYQGWANSNGSDCIAGKCNFGKGIRAYFDFQYNTPWLGHGVTFAIVSGHNTGTDIAPVYINNYTDCGGERSEHMAYAGPGTTGKGLQPPKIAVEFDPILNSGESNVCNSNSRNDNTFFFWQHSTFVYWGNNNTNTCSATSNTYDDNRHGRVGTNDPKNPDGSDINPGGTTYPYIIRDFNNFGTPIASPVGRKLSFRLEIDRVDDTASADYRKYKMRVWLKPYAIYTDSNGVTLDDTSKMFNNPPDFQQTITLTQLWHDNFDRILFGWTQSTGFSNIQTVIISNFKIDFKNKNDF